jgi:hypothetical protein
MILLPAGSITISKTWTLPSNVRLVGETPISVTDIFQLAGTVSSVTSVQAAPDLVANTPAGSTPALIQMCASGATCTGISIEHLELNGANATGQFVNGINNVGAGDQSYVDDVGMTSMGLTGLIVAGTVLSGSGPYTNINYVGGWPTFEICVRHSN